MATTKQVSRPEIQKDPRLSKDQTPTSPSIHRESLSAGTKETTTDEDKDENIVICTMSECDMR